MKINFELENTIRLDQFLTEEIDFLSREKIKKHIEAGKVTVNGEVITKAGFKLSGEGEVVFEVIEETNKLEPWDRQDLIEVIFENDDYLIINKPSGLTVHPGSGNSTNTLVNILLASGRPLSMMSSVRPGIVHRIDKNTSGLLVIAKNDEYHMNLQKQFEDKTVDKRYTLIAEGRYSHKRGMIDAPIGRDDSNRTLMKVRKKGKEAYSVFQVLESFKDNEYVEYKILTGRTHQIRVHSKYIGNPVLNDPEYSNVVFDPEFGQFLHAKSIKFLDAKGNQVSYEVEEPIEFKNKLIELR